MVPLNSYVRIPVSLKQKGCLKICKCGLSGRIENCQPLPCISYDSCMLAGRKIEHASWFHVECNICSCFAGEITCTKKQCRIPGPLSPSTKFLVKFHQIHFQFQAFLTIPSPVCHATVLRIMCLYVLATVILTPQRVLLAVLELPTLTSNSDRVTINHHVIM